MSGDGRKVSYSLCLGFTLLYSLYIKSSDYHLIERAGMRRTDRLPTLCIVPNIRLGPACKVHAGLMNFYPFPFQGNASVIWSAA